MTTLLELSIEIEHLQEALSELEGEEQNELIIQYLETKQDLQQKIENYINLIKELEGRAEFRLAESRRLAELSAVDGNLAKRLKHRLLWYMQQQGLSKLQTLRYSLSVAKVGGKVPVLIDENFPVTDLPEEFQRISIDFNKEAIREALEQGEGLEFARLGERAIYLRIK